MSSVDFKQEAKHHGFIHIVLRNLGEKPSSFFDTVLKALTELPPIQSKGTVLFLRVLNYQDLPPWALGGPKWSDFCAHKQILGVVGVGMCRDLDDLDNMLAGFKLHTAEFKNKLCESRCIIYGSKTELEGGNVDPKKGHCLIDYNTMNETPNDIKQGSLIKIIEQLALSIYKNLRNEIDELEKSINVGNSPVKFLRSPFESKDANRPEDDSVSDSRSVAAQSKARMMKHIADLSLLAGDHQMAFMWYSRAKQTKQAQNVWYAAMIEGLAVTRIIIKLCEEVLGQKAVTLSSSTLSRIPKTLGRHGTNSSTGALPSRYPLSDYTRQTPMSSSDIAQASKFATIRRPQNSAEGDTAVDKHNGGLVFKPINSVKQQDPFSSSAASEEDGSGVEEADEEEEDGESNLQVDQEMLHKDFAVDKYTEALRVYDKAKSTEPVAYLEALLKFSKYLVDQECYLRASKQLQRMFESYLSFIGDTDMLQLYCTLAEIYEGMRFHRKAALFTHYAARWASQSPKQVSKAYALVASCLSGYKLSQQLSDLLKKEESAGWPLLQAQVLKDFVFLSRRENDDELAVSHSCYLLQYLAKLLSRNEILEITTMLGEISNESKKAQQSSTPSTIITRTLCSPLPLENFPCVKSVQLIELVDLLKPIKIKGFTPPTPKKTSAMSENSQSPFIFSPFEAKRRKGKQRSEVLWVVGNPGEVLLIVENTLPFDLRVTSMLVHVETEGSKVATYPASLTLPTKSEPQDIKLLTVPSEPGLLDIKGYEATVFGIRYECKVKIPGDPIVRVVAPLPEICLRLFPALPASQECPLSPSLRVSKASITELELLDGETFECEFQIDCLSKGEKDVDVEQVTLALKDYDKDYCDISWDDSAIKAMLPLSRGCSGSFVVSICGKIPAWFRVLNEYTQGISKTTIFPDLKMESRQSSYGSSHYSYSANTTPTESPTSSPVAKRSSLLKSSNANKTKLASTRSSGSEFSFSKESSLMDSLNLDHPALTSTRNSNTLPNIRRSPGHQRNTSLGGGSTLGRQKHRGSKKFKFSNDNVWDEKRFSMVSTRSDPGEEWRNRSKTKGSEQAKAIQIPKTAETRASPYGNSPQPYYHDHGSASSSQSNSIMSRTSFGNKNVGTRKQTVVTKGSISVPVGPLIRQKPQPPSRRKIEAKFTIQYTGGRGYLEGYCRQCFAKLQIVVKPCLVFEQFDIVSNKQSREFFNLKFSVHNTSKSRMEVSISVEQDSKSNEDEGAVSLALDPNGIKEVVLVIKRFVLTANDLESDDERALTNLYSERVSKMVKVHWKDLEYDKMGVVSLNGLRLPVSTLSLLKPLPLLFGSSLNGQSYSLQLSHSRECDLGDKVKLTVMLTNSSGVCMPPSFLLFEPNFHFQQQKRMLKDLSQMLLHTGSLVVNVPQLDPGKTYDHELTLVFLLKGNYWVEVKSYMQVEGTPSFQAKIPTITSALPVETKTVSESTAAGAKGTSEPPPPVEPVMSPNRSSSGTDTLSLTESLSPTYDRSGVFSPPPRSTSPRRSPGFRRHLSSPDSPNTKAIQMAKLYEAKVAARETTVYKGLTPHPTNKKIVDSSSEKSSSSERNSLKDSTSDSVEDMAPDTSTKASDPPQPQSQNSSPAKQKRTIIDYDNISTLLSEFVPKDSLPKVSTASPVQVTSLNNPTPPPLPRGYHGTLTSDYIRGEKPVRNFKQDRFQQLLRLRAQSSKTVRVISGPQFLFSVS